MNYKREFIKLGAIHKSPYVREFKELDNATQLRLETYWKSLSGAEKRSIKSYEGREKFLLNNKDLIDGQDES